MRIKAAVLERFGEALSVEDVELEEPRSGEALIRLHACGICHTDLYTASGVDPSGYVPTVLGHEGAGVVERVGPDTTLVRPGDHVLTLFQPECGQCRHCRSTRTNLCLELREPQGHGVLPDGGTRLSRGGTPIRRFMGTSTFAEYTVMPEIALATIQPEAPLTEACVFSCGYTTGIGAATTTAAVEAGATCVIFGAGLVGLGAVAGCRLRAAARIICVDLSPSRLALASGQGATDTLLAGPNTVEAIAELTGGSGADYSFEATGDVGVMRQALDATRLGWGLCVVCGVAGKGEHLQVTPRLLIEGRRITGTEFGGIKGRTELPMLVDQWLDGRLDVAPLVTRQITLDEINLGFALLQRREGIRTVIKFDHSP